MFVKVVPTAANTNIQMAPPVPPFVNDRGKVLSDVRKVANNTVPYLRQNC